MSDGLLNVCSSEPTTEFPSGLSSRVTDRLGWLLCRGATTRPPATPFPAFRPTVGLWSHPTVNLRCLRRRLSIPTADKEFCSDPH